MNFDITLDCVVSVGLLYRSSSTSIHNSSFQPSLHSIKLILKLSEISFDASLLLSISGVKVKGGEL